MTITFQTSVILELAFKKLEFLSYLLVSTARQAQDVVQGLRSISIEPDDTLET